MSDSDEMNAQVIEEFRANGGRVASFPIPDVTIVLVHHVGRRSGIERVAPLIGQELDHGWAVFANDGGAAKHPAWYGNLLARPATVIEVGDALVPVVARTAAGAERARIWEEQVRRTPFAGEHAVAAAPREIPVVILEPRR